MVGCLAPSGRPLDAATHQETQEGLLERPVEHGVNDRVEYAGRVAEPEEPLQLDVDG